MSGQCMPNAEDAEVPAMSPFELLVPLARWRWRLLLLPLLAGALGAAASLLVEERFTAGVTFIPPQQQSTVAATALASLGAIGGLAGSASIRTPGEQYASLLQSLAVRDQLVDEFHLLEVYDEKLRTDALRRLSDRIRINVGKRDGLISIEVDDASPTRAAGIANRHVELLRELTAKLALTEAQQRRVFFEDQLKQTREKLVLAQRRLQSSGFNAGALRAEPKTSADIYARLRAEITAAEARVQGLRQSLTDSALEVQQQLSALSVLRRQMAHVESSASQSDSADYLAAYREFKYQETLFEMFGRQYELARLDESKEGALIQVVDAAREPEKRSSPKRRFLALAAAGATFVLMVVLLLATHLLRRAGEGTEHVESLNRLRKAMGRT